jgi:hypothetical protein
MTTNSARKSQLWLIAIAVPVFLALMGFVFWVGETSRQREAANTALAIRQSSSSTIDELVECLANDEIAGLSLSIPKKGGWLDENTFILINNVWHIRVYLRNLGPHTDIRVFSRDGKLREDHRTIFEKCIPGSW